MAVTVVLVESGELNAPPVDEQVLVENVLLLITDDGGVVAVDVAVDVEVVLMEQRINELRGFGFGMVSGEDGALIVDEDVNDDVDES